MSGFRESMVEIFSVAGIVALTVVAVASFGYLYSVVAGVDLKAPEWLVGAVGAVVGYFFGKRGSGNNGGGA